MSFDGAEWGAAAAWYRVGVINFKSVGKLDPLKNFVSMSSFHLVCFLVFSYTVRQHRPCRRPDFSDMSGIFSWFRFFFFFFFETTISPVILLDDTLDRFILDNERPWRKNGKHLTRSIDFELNLVEVSMHQLLNRWTRLGFCVGCIEYGRRYSGTRIWSSPCCCYFEKLNGTFALKGFIDVCSCFY